MTRASSGAETLLDTAIAALSSQRLLRFLSRQRWFGAKGEVPAAAAIADWVPLASGDTSLAVARVRVETSAGAAYYQLPIAARHSLPLAVPDSAVIAAIDGPAVIFAFDALYDPEFRALLVRGVLVGERQGNSSGARWTIERSAETLELRSAPVDTRLVGVEQSNTSVIVGDAAIIKLFRRLVPGVNPDVEVTRFLTATAGFAHTPEFLGELRFEDEHGTTIAGMTQRYVPGATDLWAHALARGRPYFAAPEDRDTPNDFLGDAERLGRTTREMHAALGRGGDDPAFAPEHVSPDDVDRWAQRAQQSVRESLALLERQVDAPGFPREREAEARALVQRRDHFLGWVNEIADTIGTDLGDRTRIHGDFHLGQVLRAPSGDLEIIDFEGEPTKPLDERREKASPLRDVAGMLRSFAYAAATLATEEGPRMKPHVRELRSGRWERDTRNAFLNGYLAPQNVDAPNPLPRNDDDTRRLIELFEAEKAFYELSYELNNRPSWVWIPMRGISKLFVAPRAS